MGDGWYPAAVRRPSVNAAYRAGRTTMTTVVCHFTVGRNSLPVMDRGYFQFLVARDGTITQGAEADAVCWHAGDPWNRRGPGIEVEYLPGFDDVLFTDAARAACGLLVRWLNTEYGVPLAFYDGPRVDAHAGFITHRSLIQSGDAHSDWWSQEDWDLMVGTTPTPMRRRRMFDFIGKVTHADGSVEFHAVSGDTPHLLAVPEVDLFIADGVRVLDRDENWLAGMRAYHAAPVGAPPLGPVTVTLPSSYTLTPNP